VVYLFSIIVMERKTRKVKRNSRCADTYKKILKVYEPLSGYSVNTDGYDSKHSLIYGELTNNGATELVNIFNKFKPIKTYPVEQRTFYDLGSGIGRIVFLIANLVPGLISKGIELVKGRHENAVKAYNKLSDSSLKKRVEFINGSFLDIPLQDAAWIYIANLCFSNEIKIELTKKLETEIRPNTLIACLSTFNFNKDIYEYLGNYKIPMSWNNSGSNVYLYRNIAGTSRY